MKIVIASDHGGYDLKRELVQYVEAMGHEVLDMGCHGESVDYPEYGKAAARKVVSGEYERGILVCGTGIGISIAANKIAGARCALCTNETMARLSMEHNDANLLAFGGRIVGPELAKGIVTAWLETPFSDGERHKRRIEQIEN